MRGRQTPVRATTFRQNLHDFVIAALTKKVTVSLDISRLSETNCDRRHQKRHDFIKRPRNSRNSKPWAALRPVQQRIASALGAVGCCWRCCCYRRRSVALARKAGARAQRQRDDGGRVSLLRNQRCRPVEPQRNADGLFRAEFSSMLRFLVVAAVAFRPR